MRLFSVLVILFSMNAANANVPRPSAQQFQEIARIANSFFKTPGVSQILCFDTDGSRDLVLGGIVSPAGGKLRLLFNMGRVGFRPADRNGNEQSRLAGYTMNYSAIVEGRRVEARFTAFSRSETPSEATLVFGEGTPARRLHCYEAKL